MEEEDKQKKKTNSRKFIVWISFTLLTFFIVIGSGITAAIVKGISDKVVELIEKTLSSYCVVSSLYLGCNVGQKVGIAFADNLATKEDEKTDEQENK